MGFIIGAGCDSRREDPGGNVELAIVSGKRRGGWVFHEKRRASSEGKIGGQ